MTALKQSASLVPPVGFLKLGAVDIDVKRDECPKNRLSDTASDSQKKFDFVFKMAALSFLLTRQPDLGDQP